MTIAPTRSSSLSMGHRRDRQNARERYIGRAPRRLLHRRGPRAPNCSGGLHPVWVAPDKSARQYLVPGSEPPGWARQERSFPLRSRIPARCPTARLTIAMVVQALEKTWRSARERRAGDAGAHHPSRRMWPSKSPAAERGFLQRIERARAIAVVAVAQWRPDCRIRARAIYLKYRDNPLWVSAVSFVMTHRDRTGWLGGGIRTMLMGKDPSEVCVLLPWASDATWVKGWPRW